MKKIKQILFISLLILLTGCHRSDKEENSLPDKGESYTVLKISASETVSADDGREQTQSGRTIEEDTEAYWQAREEEFREIVQQFVKLQKELYPKRKYFEQDLYYDNGTVVYSFRYDDITLVRDNRFNFVYEEDGKKVLLDGMGYEAMGVPDKFDVYLYDMTGDGQDDIVICFDSRGYNVLHIVDVKQVKSIPFLFEEELLTDRVSEILEENDIDLSTDYIRRNYRIEDNQIYVGGFAFCEDMNYLWYVDWLCEYTEEGFAVTGEPRIYRELNMDMVSSHLSYWQHYYKEIFPDVSLSGEEGRLGIYNTGAEPENLYLVVSVNGVGVAGKRTDLNREAYTELTEAEVTEIMQSGDYRLLDMAVIE